VRGATGEPRYEPRYFVKVGEDIEMRKRMELVLRESELRFRTMANMIPQLARIARADGHLEWYNDRWYKNTVTTPEQMEGWGWQCVHDPRELPRVLEKWKLAIATSVAMDTAFPLRGADGVFRTFHTHVQPLHDSQGEYRSGSARIRMLKL
jgi:PAS domain-containing protein